MSSMRDSISEENRRIRMLRVLGDLLIQTIMTRPVSLSDVDKMINGLRSFAVKLFPGKEHVFDLIYLPRFRRALREAGLLTGNLRLVLEPHSRQQFEEVAEHEGP